MGLDDPLLPIGVHEHHSAIFARIIRKDLAKTRKVRAHKSGPVWISSGTFSDTVLDRGVEPL